jgi:hypothetical protein
MAIMFSVDQVIKNFKPPFIAQEYFNHNATIFKIFVIGSFFAVVKRKSTPNLDLNSKEKETKQKFIF